MRFFAGLLTALVALSPLAHADTTLAGSDFSAISGGIGLCPMSDDCLQAAQQFTVFAPVLIDEIKVVVTAPGLIPTDGIFQVNLGGALGSFPIPIGSGDIIVDPKGGPVQEEFDFTGLDISLATGTY